MTNHFNHLLQRYLDKTATGEERQEFFELIQSEKHSEEIGDSFMEMLEIEVQKPTSVEEKIIREHIFYQIIESHPAAPHPALHVTPAPTATTPARPGRKYQWLSVAAVLLITIAATVWMVVERAGIRVQPQPPELISFTGPQFIRLPDASTVLLNKNSTLQYSNAYGEELRELTLLGEAYFDVKPHASARFIVHAGKVTTTVLGTAFNIKAYPGNSKVIVTVTRGRVQVANNTEVYGFITPNQQIAVNTSTNRFVKEKVVDAATTLEWKSHYLILDRVSMEEASRIISKKYNVKITVANSKLKGCRIFATFLQEEKLVDVLKVLSTVVGASYIIKDGDVTITGDGTKCD